MSVYFVGNTAVIDSNRNINAGITTSTEFIGKGALPIGSIIPWNSATYPSGWVLCDGQTGTPDLRGKIIHGSGGSTFFFNTDAGETRYGSRVLREFFLAKKSADKNPGIWRLAAVTTEGGTTLNTVISTITILPNNSFNYLTDNEETIIPSRSVQNEGFVPERNTPYIVQRSRDNGVTWVNIQSNSRPTQGADYRLYSTSLNYAENQSVGSLENYFYGPPNNVRIIQYDDGNSGDGDFDDFTIRPMLGEFYTQSGFYYYKYFVRQTVAVRYIMRVS